MYKRLFFVLLMICLFGNANNEFIKPPKKQKKESRAHLLEDVGYIAADMLKKSVSITKRTANTQGALIAIEESVLEQTYGKKDSHEDLQKKRDKIESIKARVDSIERELQNIEYDLISLCP